MIELIEIFGVKIIWRSRGLSEADPEVKIITYIALVYIITFIIIDTCRYIRRCKSKRLKTQSTVLHNPNPEQFY